MTYKEYKYWVFRLVNELDIPKKEAFIFMKGLFG